MVKFNNGDVAAKSKDREVVVAELREHPKATVNEEGGLAFDTGPKMELYTRVATCLVGEPKFYDAAGKETLAAIRALIEKVAKKDPEFILKLAAHVRQALQTPAVGNRFRELGVEPSGVSGDQFNEIVRRDSARWGEIIRRNNLRAD